MKRAFLSLLLLCLVLVVAGCASEELTPVIGLDPTVTSIYVGGRPAGLSTRADSLVAVSGVQSENDQLLLHVGYNNTSPFLIDALPETIRVTGYSRSGLAADLPVYEADEYLDQLRGEQAAALIFQTIGALHHLRDSHYHKRTQTVERYQGPGFSYYWRSTTTDHGSGFFDYLALMDTARDYSERIRALDQALLRRTSVLPNQHIEGLIVVYSHPEYDYRFLVSVPFGNDVHQLEFVRE